MRKATLALRANDGRLYDSPEATLAARWTAAEIGRSSAATVGGCA